MIRHALAPILPAAARALDIPRTLPDAARPLPDAADPPVVAITFDDGPHPEGTPRILEILAAAGASATFFVVGEQVRRRPAIARQILDEGHSLALHGDRHLLQLRLTGRQLERDLEHGRAAIEDATGTTPSHHRPPYGIYSPAGLRAARSSSLQPLLWSTWGKDWRARTTPERIAARATRELAPGAVILLHDADFYSAKRSHERTALALPIILGRLQALKIGTVSII